MILRFQTALRALLTAQGIDPPKKQKRPGEHQRNPKMDFTRWPDLD
jgi:hypothetical protein